MSGFQKFGLFLGFIVFICLVGMIQSNLRSFTVFKTVDEKRRWDEMRELLKDKPSPSPSPDNADSSSSSASSGSSDVITTPSPSAKEISPEATGASNEFQRIKDSAAGVSFLVPDSWTREETTDSLGDRSLSFGSPDGEASLSFKWKTDPDNAFVSATEDRLRALKRSGYKVSDPEPSLVSGEDCVRWTYSDTKTRSIHRLLWREGKEYEFVLRFPQSKYEKWKPTLDKIHTSFHLRDAGDDAINGE